MSTIVGTRCRDGAVVAGDRVLVRDGRIASRSRQHVFDLDDVGVAAVGTDVDRFADRLESELRSYRLERGSVSLSTLERLASDVARETATEAVVATHDEDGAVALRSLATDGSALSDPPMALGSGASLALGQLEATGFASLSVAAAETAVRELFEAVAERDPGTGDGIDVWTAVDSEGAADA
jgi:proteasome beta subunit